MTYKIKTTEAPNYNFPVGWTTVAQRAATPNDAVFQAIRWLADLGVSVDDYVIPTVKKSTPHNFNVKVKIGRGIVKYAS